MLNSPSNLGRLDAAERTIRLLVVVRWLLPIGWSLATIGFLGPWVVHPTAALTLSGADMAEFVKFLPGALDGSLRVTRQWFYMPPFAITASIVLLIGLHDLRYPNLLRGLGLLLAMFISFQLLPPAWSPSSLMAAEFRIQTFALGISWMLLIGSWFLRRLPSWLLGSLGAGLSLIALVLPVWQFLMAKPAIDQGYGVPPDAGWGLFVCSIGLAVTAVASGALAPTRGAWTKGRGAVR